MDFSSWDKDEGQGPPPGSGPTQKFDGPWFSTQLTLSLAIGITSFLLFCFLRTRWEIVYMGRTKLKDFSPTAAHSPDVQGSSGLRRFFGWIGPTLRTSEFTVLQTVGLDAAVLLNFFRMSFLLFSLLATLAMLVLMPVNFFRHGTTDAAPDLPSNDTNSDPDMLFFLAPGPGNGTAPPEPSFYDILIDPQTSALLHLIFVYLFTSLLLTFLHRNFHRYVQSRQTFALHLIHSISARTVLVTALPAHLRGDRALAEYFESCGWDVESVSVVREVGPLKRALDRRTQALVALEQAWAQWVGNPANVTVAGYDPNLYAKQAQAQGPPDVPTATLVNVDGDSSAPDSAAASDADVEAARPRARLDTDRPRPTFRPRWFGAKVDAIEHWEARYRAADDEVRGMRRSDKFDATHAAFVTFEDVKNAQIACQVVHYPHHSQVVTEPAPEPRDVVWSKVGMSQREAQVRDIIIMGVMTLLLLFWIPPVSSLAGLLSYREIKKIAPWLARLIDASPRFRAIVQNSLPSLALVSFNGFLPFLLEWLSYEQGFKSRSSTEYSVMRKYYLFLLISVLAIFLLTTTYFAVFRDLADTPMKIPEKLANGLQGAVARNFMVSYVMLQALGLMPLQLLNLGPLLGLAWARAFSTKTPRDYAEANAPPMLNYGWVYPQALLIFTITLVYSIISPLILVFGAVYFGVAYLVYKYKLLFIYFKPYESNGEAWAIASRRQLWALFIFQLFMTGLFSLRGNYYFTLAMAPLLLYTLWWSWTMFRDFGPLGRYLALSSVCEVERGEEAERVVGIGESGPTRSQSNLNHRRYAVNDETLYVAPSDRRTDYSQPPMSAFYPGVLNTGRRRYAHPALSGSLPTPWLPVQERERAFGQSARERRGVVLSLRRKMAKKLSRARADADDNDGGDASPAPEGGPGSAGRARSRDNLAVPEEWVTGASIREPARQASASSSAADPWRDEGGAWPSGAGARAEARPGSSGAGLKNKLSFDGASGVIALPEDANVWARDTPSDDDDGEGGAMSASPSTYFHRPNRLRSLSGANRMAADPPRVPESGLPQ
ncbi:hypothetical protein Q5752_007051 [Cryptotrichosporon argae]